MAAPSAQQLSPLAGYTTEFGQKYAFVGELAGPAAYVAGGQTINASQLGWGGFDSFDCPGGNSYSTTFYCRVTYLPVQVSPANFNPGCNSVKVQWFVSATNAEVAGGVNLSGELIRVFCIGV